MDKSEKSIKKNFYISNVLITSGAVFLAPVFYIYLTNIGYSNTEIGFYLGIFWLVSSLVEVPLGYITDIYGTKFTILLATALKILGLILIVNPERHSVLLYMSASLTGIGEAGYSGVLSSWLMNNYNDIRKDEEKNSDVQIIFARANTICNIISIVLGFISAQILFKFQINYSIIASIIMFTISLIYFLFFFPDDKKNKNPNIRELKAKDEFKSILSDNHKLILVFLYFTIPLIIDIGPSNQWSKMFEDMNITGYIWFFINLIMILANFSIAKIKMEKYLNIKSKIIFIDIVLIHAIAFLNLGIEIKLLLFLLHVFVFSFVTTMNGILLQTRVIKKNERRNTIISSFNLFNSLLVSTLLPLLGILGDAFGIGKSWAMFTWIALVCLFLLDKKFLRQDEFYETKN